MRDKRFESKLGLGQLLVYLPTLSITGMGSALVMLGILVVQQYRNAAWLHGGSVDVDHLLYAGPPFVDPTSADATSLITQAFTSLLTPLSLFASVLVQNVLSVGFAVVILLGGIRFRRRRGAKASRSRLLAEALGLRNLRAPWWALGVFCGLTLPWFPEALMAVVARFVELDNASSIMLGNAVRSSSPSMLVLAFFTVAIFVPLMEELLFRGFLWHLGEHWLNPWILLVFTSLAFAVVHMSPAHVLGVLTHAFLLGWLRWRSGSILPSTLAHMINNSIATASMIWMPDAAPPTVPAIIAMGVLGAASIGLVAYAAWRMRVESQGNVPNSSSG